ncbi:MAG: ATP-binding protein [Dehalococcoidia bacterium]
MKASLAIRASAGGLLVALAAFIFGAVSYGSDQPPWALFMDGAILLVVAAAAAYFAFRQTSRTISDITGAALRLGEGDFQTRVPGSDGTNAKLTGSFNEMARQVEARIAEASAEHARLEAVLDASSDSTIALSNDTTIRFMNRAASVLAEIAPGSAVGRPLIEAVRDYELDALVRRATAPGAQPETAVVTFGAHRLPLRAAAMRIAEGRGWDMLLVLTDLSEVTRLDQVRRDFIGNVSHELRTPLAGIRALAETIESGNVDPGPQTTEFASRIIAQVDRLTILVTELLDLSRIESGAMPLDPQPTDLAVLVAESASLLQTRLEKGGITVSAPPAPGPIAEIDRSSLQRAMNNLLDNAIKFSPAGATIHVAASDEGELAVISVRDEGPGIPAHELPRVFERFYKGDASRASSGVGLGLAIVKHVVRAHGGTVEATAEPSGGATFTMRVPKHFVAARGRARRDVRG